jgi:hypothetical protein
VLIKSPDLQLEPGEEALQEENGEEEFFLDWTYAVLKIPDKMGLR